MGSGSGLNHYYNLREIMVAASIVGPESKELSWDGTKPLMRLFADDFRLCLKSFLDNHSSEQYQVVGKTGSSGHWSYIPYCAMLSPLYCATINGCSPSKGVFPIYLLSEDSQKMHLAYMLGVGSKNQRTLNKMTSKIIERFDLEGFSTKTSDMNLGRDLHNYKDATIWYVSYDLHKTPINEVLENDLLQIIRFHEQFGPEIFKIITDVNQSKY